MSIVLKPSQVVLKTTTWDQRCEFSQPSPGTIIFSEQNFKLPLGKMRVNYDYGNVE